MEIAGNLYNRNLGIKNRETDFYNDNRTEKTEKKTNQEVYGYRNLNELFINESRQEFLKKLKSKNSLPFLTQILNQNQTTFSEKKQSTAINAYSNSIKISELIYGNIEYSHFFA